MKTDTLFYQLFQTFPTLLFELIEGSIESVESYQFSSVEVKQLAFRIDGVFLPTTADLPIYFTEVQFQSDPGFYARFFAEIFLYLKQSPRENDWRGVILYPDRRVESTKKERYRELLNGERVKIVYLNELEEISEGSIGWAALELVILEESQVIEKGRDLMIKVRSIDDPNQQRDLLKLIETILIYKLSRLDRREIEAMFSLNELRQTRVFQEALEEGRQEGRQEGENAGKLASVPLLLQLGATPEQIATSLGLSLEQVLAVACSQGE
jgi:predicted transposase/invertase (TIGR01784 family)